jgi:hypothetical protein
MAITALGSDLPAESKKGAGTGANLQESVRQDYLEADASAAEGDFHEQVLRPWAAANFGDPDVAPFPRYPVDPPEDRMQLGQALQAFGSGLKTIEDAGWEFKDSNDFEDLFGWALQRKPKEEKPPVVTMPFGAPRLPGVPGAPQLPAGPTLPAAPGTPVAPPSKAALVESFEEYAFQRGASLTKAEVRALGKLPHRQAIEEFASMFKSGGGRRFCTRPANDWRMVA